MQERLEAVVRGRVQFVMYRDFARRKARELGLVGEVENLSDGTVRVIAEGPRQKTEFLLAHLRQGPILADVKSVDVKRTPVSGTYHSFEISYG